MSHTYYDVVQMRVRHLGQVDKIEQLDFGRPRKGGE